MHGRTETEPTKSRAIDEGECHLPSHWPMLGRLNTLREAEKDVMSVDAIQETVGAPQYVFETMDAEQIASRLPRSTNALCCLWWIQKRTF